MILFDIAELVTVMKQGEKQWIGVDIPVESMEGVVLLLTDLAEYELIRICRRHRAKNTATDVIVKVLIEKL